MKRATDDWYVEPGDFSMGQVGQLTEFDGWTDEELTEFEARQARRRPIGFGAEWPADDSPEDT